MEDKDYRLVHNQVVIDKIIKYLQKGNFLKLPKYNIEVEPPLSFSVDLYPENVGKCVISSRTFLEGRGNYYGEIFVFCEVLNCRTIYDILNFLTTDSNKEYKYLELKIDHCIVPSYFLLFFDRYYDKLETVYDVLSKQVKFPNKFIFYYYYWSEFNYKRHYGVIESTETNCRERTYLNLNDYENCRRVLFEPGYFSKLFNHFKNYLFCSESS